jgi:hypothetical protein
MAEASGTLEAMDNFARVASERRMAPPSSPHWWNGKSMPAPAARRWRAQRW